MKIENEILINKYGQGLIPSEQLTDDFCLLDFSQQKSFLNDIVYLIVQSKPKDEDIQVAIEQSKLKPTYTSCILLKKGVARHNLQKLIELPEFELKRTFILLISLFKIAYKRRFDLEKNNPDKWWYWDLSDAAKVDAIIKNRS